MTNKEIMQASLLDIVFDNRNKNYGAYALRREYPKRLTKALSIAISLIGLILLLNSFSFKSSSSGPLKPDDNIITIQTIEFPDPPKEPEIPQEQPPPQTATADYQEIKIVPDDQVKETIVTNEDIRDKIISNVNLDGIKDSGLVKIPENPVLNAGTGTTEEKPQSQPPLIFSKTDPEYPGGQDALMRFLQTNLNTPDELEAGKQKTVQVRFKINAEGAVSDIEIYKTGGEAFDKEVIRVCKKMKRWKPATQNGYNVPISFVLPVTFIAYEE